MMKRKINGASQQKLNGSTTAGYQIKTNQKIGFPYLRNATKTQPAHGSKVQTHPSETFG